MKIFKSLYRSVKQATKNDAEVQNLIKKYPRLSSFFKKRFDRTKFSGVYLTILGLVFFYVLIILSGVIEDFLTSDIITNVDVRTNILLYAFRNATVIKTFIWITLLGEISVVAIFIVLTSLVLWAAHKKWQMIALWITIIGSEAITFITKFILHRPRPANAALLETSGSFPSGHATISVAFYGFLSYLLFRKAKKKKTRGLIVLVTLILIAAIGFSRLYLGVHYVSDIWAGYLVGLLGLIAGISLVEAKIFQKENRPGWLNVVSKYQKIIPVGALATAAIFYIIYGFLYHPVFLTPLPTTTQSTVANTIDVFNNPNLPRYTETLTGATQEPISLIIATKDDTSFVATFEKAGWTLADQINFASTVALAKYSLLNQEYIAAPMTPSFWNKEIHNFGFEKSTAANSVRQRHHARFWKTNFKTTDGKNIYVGTASLDIGVKWLITHTINPDIDTERDLLFADLQKVDNFTDFQKIKFVKPVLGKNFSGDPFFTDGESYLINFEK